MKNRTISLILLAIVLAGFYAYRFTDWFAEKKIQIKYRTLPERGSPNSVEPITFYLEKEYPITSLKVFSVTEVTTNKYPHALWHLVAVSNSALVTDFVYGGAIPGMTPKIAGMVPEPLRPNESYRIILEANKLTGEKEFQTRARSAK